MAIKVAGQEVISDTRKITGAIGLDLTPIEATIADTAVDVFVYDTRKDSDGGAWRKRTQHTSWYNETLNTATRGSRKEFPAVAVIVAEATQVTIYDGDDPDLPMWMVFNGSIYDMLGTTSVNINSGIYALNAKLGVTNSAYGVSIVDFIKDDAFKYRDNVARTLSGYYKGSILERNDSNNYDGTDPYGIIVNDDNNDIAMTVLPNAPIDPATQLPIPTIAVATDGGVSVIKDDGTVVDITLPSTYNYIYSVDFIGTDKIAFSADNSTDTRSYRVHAIPSSDVAITAQLEKQSSLEFYADGAYTPTNTDIQLTPSSTLTIRDVVNNGDNTRIIGGANNTDWGGVYNVSVATDPSKSLHSHITSTYNTGWMNGDIKLATLSSTDATNVTGTELVTNGTFDTDTSGWSSTNAVISADSSGYLVVDDTADAGTDSRAYQDITTVVGKTYVLSFDKISTTSAFYLAIGTTSSYSSIYYRSLGTSTGAYSLTFKATATTTRISMISGGTGITKYDNISVRLAEEDRSVNGNGLQVFGTVTKTPVNTGADLVGYSGFANGASYLKQPNNPDLELNGDFSWSFWVKDNVTVTDYYFEYGDSARTSTPYAVLASSTNISAVTANSGSVGASWPSRGAGIWTHIYVVHSNNLLSLYINGKLANTDTTSGSIAYNGQEELWIGLAAGATSSAGGASLALFRISATAPTAEQIKTIYESEKHLFTEGAQATLAGTSNAVTALAYDSDENILHVGTSYGRSSFSGLRRVDNTTTGVTTAISASNGMVVEQ